MKRKARQLVAGTAHQKRPCRNGRNKEPEEPCFLIHLLVQYGILESIISHLFPVDLYSLAATSKAAYKAIFPRKESRANLLKKMDCDGTGIQIRSQCHLKSGYFETFACTEIATCGTMAKDANIESRPCSECGITTCDECRVHCVYQSIFQPADYEDELPNFSGFVLLHKDEMGILSPAHLGETGPAAGWDCASTHHDQGVLDSPLGSDVFAASESIDEIINTDLGSGQLKVTYASNLPHPSPVIQAFWEITENRKRLFCDDCFEEKAAQQQEHHSQCHCTLKNRFLDRWLCLKCYQAEEQASLHGALDAGALVCPCGQEIGETSARLVCMWCWGEVSDSFQNPATVSF
ncbi:hypothetical protein K504DRAFT_381051 [Pleomassaria siparia CBS 279.74]|uniref:Uncharacterized protein n=1 Tax=Pleomassaria siparia CBS 279.74 TaxID=1314801 RepID=A0A6G1K9N7_9PLEO|nr:hypothetical protein K504DRAFT_381051 [Pleomassaria siparia CBS 279.74]